MASKPLNNVQSTSAGHYSAALKQHSTSRGYQYYRESTNKAFANRPGALDRVNIIVEVFKTKLWGATPHLHTSQVDFEKTNKNKIWWTQFLRLAR